jgi:Zn-dependent membrane protease YugP
MGIYWDPMYFVFLAPAMLLALYASIKTKGAFSHYSRVANASGLSGAEAAAQMLRGKGIEVVPTSQQARGMRNAVAIERVGGVLTDHYDPQARTLRLSPEVYAGRSLCAARASHGHGACGVVRLLAGVSPDSAGRDHGPSAADLGGHHRLLGDRLLPACHTAGGV